ncbi:ExeM/NucH family extracellular endonuclease [Aliidiomarina indica]|uniref:ExeM/NucH family extracellular endonuclease n=1 Tax=Aliidiomarina indica TaxID=2749147 RepID=UPI00189031A8|nr:ExeM/NucH family extracellular endonuclease [Aliidiomarina indica]
MRMLLAVILLVIAVAPSWAQEPIAYWAQNDNVLADGSNGFSPDSFPQQADEGSGILYLQNFDETLTSAGAYQRILSFAGSTQNRLSTSYPSGGSLSIQGGAGLSNNGAQVVMEVDTTGFQDIRFSLAINTTATGFDTRVFEWSTDGVNYTEFATDQGRGSWFVRSYDLSDVNELNDNNQVYIRITIDGATNASGNNRFDNILVSGVSLDSLTRMTVYDRDFADDPFSRGWQQVNVVGDVPWDWNGSFANVSYSTFSGGSCSEADSWMISPAFDLDRQSGERLLVDVARGFNGSNGLEVYFSSSYDGSGVIDAADWTLITEITGNDFSSNNTPVSFGPFDTLQGESGLGYVAFRYAFDSGNCSTWRIANFAIEADVQNNESPFQCGAHADAIHWVQGFGFQSPVQGAQVQVEAIVTASFQDTFDGGLGGFYLQEADENHDDNPLTSEGIFVYDNNFGVNVNVGDKVRVAGVVGEFFGHTQIQDVTDVAVCATNQLGRVSPVAVELPAASLIDFESIEGMWVETTQSLTVTDVFNVARFGEIGVSKGRIFQPTQVVRAGDDARALQAENDRNRLLIDNARTGTYRTPYMTGADGFSELSASNPIRNGFVVNPGFSGIMGYAFNAYRIRSEATPEFDTNANARSEEPQMQQTGNLRIGTYNVENLFTTFQQSGNSCGPNALGCRGARNQNELDRQLDKVTSAILATNADMLALVEIENDGNDATLAMLVSALNAADNRADWAYIPTGFVGTDAIKPAFIYRTGSLALEGDLAVLTSAVDPDFDDSRQRPALAQSFRAPTGQVFTAVAVHLRAKASCPSGSGPNADSGDGQGCWNEWRTLSAGALTRWMETDPTGTGADAVVILGDFNAYAMEDPLLALKDAGYANLAIAANGGSPEVYSYTFMGQAGSLDHAYANNAFAQYVVDARAWHINSDETPAFNYEERLPSSSWFKPASFYNADPYRSSDHDPLIIELNLLPTCAPGIGNRPAHPRGKQLPVPQCGNSNRGGNGR